jgi:hypothetical protein
MTSAFIGAAFAGLVGTATAADTLPQSRQFNVTSIDGTVIKGQADLPAGPSKTAVIASIGFYLVEEDDEFQRTIMVQSYLLATGATLALCTVAGFLQSFKLAPPIELWVVFPLLAVCLPPAQYLVGRRYRR